MDCCNCHAGSGPVHFESAQSRRDFLLRAGGGFGALALWSLMSKRRTRGGGSRGVDWRQSIGAESRRRCRRKPNRSFGASSTAAPAIIDLFDPKPTLNKLAGKPLPGSFPRPETAMGKTAFTPLMASQRKFKQYGQSGIWVSDWLPEIAQCVDDIAVIRSLLGRWAHARRQRLRNEHRLHFDGPALPWFLGSLRPGLRMRQSARLRGADRLFAGASRRQPAVEHRLHALDLRRHEVPRRQNANSPRRTARRCVGGTRSGAKSISSRS